MLKKLTAVLKRYKLEVFSLFSISILFIFLRFYKLKFLPIFIDEAIYIRWAQQGLYDPALRFISLTDGKQPFFIWLITVLTNYIHNPLLAGRLVSIGAGIMTMVGLMLLCLEMFKNRWVGVISVLLYTFYPFALVLNRMAVYESLVGAFSIWCFYLALILINRVTLGPSLVLGLLLGGSILTKSSGFINIYLLPIMLMLFKFSKKTIGKLFMLLLFSSLAILLAFLLYSILLLSDKFYMISEKNALFTYHLSELIPYKAFLKWPANILELLYWTITYLTYPLTFLALFSLVEKNNRKEKFLLFFWFLVPILVIALFNRTLFPRYIFSATLVLLPLIALSIMKLKLYFKNHIIYSLIIISTVGLLGFSNYKIIMDMPHAFIPDIEIQQYANSVYSGEGFKKIIPYLQDKAKREKIIVASEGTYGSLPGTILEIYFDHNVQVERYKFETLPKQLPKELYNIAKTKPVYIIFNETQTIHSWPLDLIMRFKRGSSNLYLSLYKIRN